MISSAHITVLTVCCMDGVSVALVWENVYLEQKYYLLINKTFVFTFFKCTN